MISLRRTLLCLICLVAGATVTAQAQDAPMRTDRTFYGKFGLGLSDYSGDFDPQPFDFNEFKSNNTSGFPWEASAELGYQFSPRFALGTGYRFGNFPRVENAVPGDDSFRHTVMALGRFTAGGASWRLAPYADVGGNATLGGSSTAFGPSGGLGVDIALSQRTSLYAEARSHWTFDDEALDGADTGNAFDAATTLFGAGVKVAFKRPERAPQVLALDGPTTLDAGTPGTYTVTADERASEPVTYRWAFGDGESATGATVEHTFRSPGSYTVSVTASNEAGSASRTLRTTVAPRPARIVALNASPNPATTNQTIRFTSDVAGDDVTRTWDFGDGTTQTGASASHAYEDPGTYTVTLTASNSRGATRESVQMSVEQALASICRQVSDFNAAFFSRNSSVLSSDAENLLRENVEVLSQCPNLEVRVEGFASPLERNADQLAMDRARAVEAFYSERGLDRDRIRVEDGVVLTGQTTKVGGDDQLRRADSTPVPTALGAN